MSIFFRTTHVPSCWFSLENSTFYRFPRPAGNFTLTVNGIQCQGGSNSQQVALFNFCTFTTSTQVSCTIGTGNVNLAVSNADPAGTMYYLWLDGNAGAFCRFDINYSPPPNVNMSTNGSITCITNTAQAIATTTTSPVTYSWAGPGVVSGQTTPIVNVNSARVYSVTITNTATTCSSTRTVNVSSSVTLPSITSSTTGITCNTSTAQAILSTTTTPVSYNWIGPGIVSGNATSTITVNTGGTYNYTVTNTSNSFRTTGSVIVPANTTSPSITSTSAGTLTCTNTLVTTGVVSSPSTSVSYNWSGPSVVSGGSSATASVNQSGTYNFTITNTSNDCRRTGTTSVTQNTVTLDVNGSVTNSITCSVTTASVIASTIATPVSYTWTGPSIVKYEVHPLVLLPIYFVRHRFSILAIY